ncbi:MAG: hypothetical protein JWN98_1968 [Abditibacteriota bacterium]|nr:hypothetical protein [Abditibacteriota bacterium]
MSSSQASPSPSISHSFRYLPPGSEEQRAFALQFVGTLLSVALALVLSFATRESGLKAVLWGASIGAIWLLARAAWQLELKARRSQHEGLRIEESGLFIEKGSGGELWVWRDIEECEARGGKLYVKSTQSTLELSAREIENGMELLREIVSRWHQAHGQQSTPSNFIPLSPR